MTLVAAACTVDGTSGTAPSPPGSSVSASPRQTLEPIESGSLRIGIGADPAAIDPRFVTDAEGLLVADALFDGLVALDEDLEVVPAAARDVGVNRDGTVLTFRLHDDGVFHDGTPVLARHFVRSLRRIADGTGDPRSPVAHLLEPVRGFGAAQREGRPLRGVRAVGERTLRIRLSRPAPEFLSALAHPALAPMPTDAAGEEFAERPVGNGPFEMSAAWEHDQFIRVARFEDHYDVPASLDDVVFQIYPGRSSADRQWSDLQEGLLHVGEVPLSERATAAEEFGTSVDGYQGPGLLDGATSTIYYYGFNTERAPFDDERVRRALSLLIDRETIARDVLGEARLPADAIVPGVIPGAPGDTCGHCRYDPDEARALLAEVDGTQVLEEPLRLRYNEGRTHRAIAEQIAGDIEDELDVEVLLDATDLASHVTQLQAGEMGIFRLGWQPEVPSMGAYLYPLFHSDSAGEDNLTRYADDDVDDLLERARRSNEASRRNQLWRRAEERILAHVPIAPVLVYRHMQAVRPEVRGLRIDPLGRIDLTRVFLDGES